MTDYLNDNIGPDEMVAICWLYTTIKHASCKCHLWATETEPGECTRCKSLRMARVAWPFTVGFIEGVN